MKPPAQQILRTYVTLTFLSTLASSFIWGINTLFLLDAGLSITEAFLANAFFTLGQVLFEIPTGVVADSFGRRLSFLLGTATLLITTLLYFLLWQTSAPFWQWAIVSALLGLGFTFFSGATEAWLVDGLTATGYKGTLEEAFARGQVANGIAMLIGTVSGGAIAQIADLGMPYIVRSIVLGVTFAVSYGLMYDIGFKPVRGTSVSNEMTAILRASVRHGLANRPVRWMILAGPFTLGVSVYGFYAIQPYLLELYGDTTSYVIAGIAAALIAGTQIAGGLLVSRMRRLFSTRTALLLTTTGVSALALFSIGLFPDFWVVITALAVWATVFAASFPVRQSYLNGLIPSAQRATVLSSANLIGSGGGVVVQPALGKAADVGGYPLSYVIGAAIQLLAIPFILLAKREHAASDQISD